MLCSSMSVYTWAGSRQGMTLPGCSSRQHRNKRNHARNCRVMRYLKDLCGGPAATQSQNCVSESPPGLLDSALIVQPDLLKGAERVRGQHLCPLVREVPGCTSTPCPQHARRTIPPVIVRSFKSSLLPKCHAGGCDVHFRLCRHRMSVRSTSFRYQSVPGLETTITTPMSA